MILTKFLFLLAIGVLQIIYVGNILADTPDDWSTVFVKRLDGGHVATPLSDPRFPPQIEVIFVSWDGTRFEAVADYNNASSAAITIEGREVTDPVTLSQDFYPYAVLEVSNDKTAGWKAVGNSPARSGGATISILMVPNSLSERARGASNRSCYFEIDPFRSLVGKFRYGRIVLKNGEKSQTIVLSDLRPDPKTASPK